MTAAAAAIQGEIDTIDAKLAKCKMQSLPSEPLKRLIDQALDDNLTTLPVIAVVCKAVRSMSWGMDVLATLHSQRYARLYMCVLFLRGGLIDCFYSYIDLR